MRGGEKVLLALARLFPDAPIFTLLHVKGSLCPELEARELHTTFVQRLPGVATRYREYLPLFPAAAASIDLSGFDLVISSSHCVAKGVRVPPGAVHLCYCHTPMRYVWDRYHDYFGPGRVGGPARFVLPLVAQSLRAWDVATARGVHAFATNSRHVAGRIQRYYGRPAVVIPPPVDVDFFTPGPGDPGPGTYDLVVSALVPYKRVQLVLDAYRDTGWPLKIVGTGPPGEETRLRARLPAEASLLGRVDDETLRELYRGCRAVLMAGVEDFGIVPLEAMACGRPAVVFAEGGGPESVVPGESGVLFHEPTAPALRAAVDSLQAMRFNIAALRARAETHRREVFEARVRDFVEQASADSPIR
ncbi:MAG: glycosyltransferase family 4 protein [Acidobacteria bacterium]|nr:MAG: glycosyltransferase family 4 protein [Acidobacteriota bacterium]